MPHSIMPHLMFEGSAEEAMNFYVSLFKNSEITAIVHYGEDEAGAGLVKRAIFSLNNEKFSCADSPVEHQFTFTPSLSLFVECEDEAELREAFAQLSTDGVVLMPLNDYGFSSLFGWLNDRFGVSWQLNLT